MQSLLLTSAVTWNALRRGFALLSRDKLLQQTTVVALLHNATRLRLRDIENAE